MTLAADGEILVEGPTVAGGGVLRTGDLGRFDADGRLRRRRPQVRHDRHRRRERRARRGRGGAARAPRRRRGRRLRPPGPASGARRSPRASCCAPPADPQELRALVRRAARALQGAQGGRGGGRAAAHAIWEAAAPGAAMSERHRQREPRPLGPRRARAGAHAPTSCAARRCPSSAWMVDAIGPQPGDTLLELAAGPGDTGLPRRRADPARRDADLARTSCPEMLNVAQRARAGARARQRPLQADRRRDLDRHRGRERRRRPVPLGLHADGRPGDRAARDAPRAQAGRRGSRWRRGPGPRTTRGARSPPASWCAAGSRSARPPASPGQFAWAAGGRDRRAPRGRRLRRVRGRRGRLHARATTSLDDWWETTARRCRAASPTSLAGVDAGGRSRRSSAALGERGRGASRASDGSIDAARAHVGRLSRRLSLQRCR